ncbi:hypothetical protein [Streptomyces sp. NPDC056144]|uniref:hypothetical protein n=1 Tax=unclassified Streptomyces TaxID=2593676 RepID=UPI0035DC5587
MACQQSNAVVSAYPDSFQIPADAPASGLIRVRFRHTESFTVVGNHLGQHPTLDPFAMGLGLHIQSKPPGANVTVKKLVERFGCEIRIRRALNELAAAGYLLRVRVPLERGRFSTRVVWFENPQSRMAAPTPPPPPPPAPVEPVPDPTPEPEPVRTKAPAPVRAPEAPATPATDILARLRTQDPRLCLSRRDVERLAPAVDEWLARDLSPAQVVRTLTATLPPAHVPIHHPARFVAYRLSAFLPPRLPAASPPQAAPPPLVTCDGCDRAFRSHDPDASCAECRTAA